MKLRTILGSLFTPNNKSEEESSTLDSGQTPNNTDQYNYDPAVEECKPFNASGYRSVHTEEYNTALQIAEEFGQIDEYESRITFWKKHFTVFGPASVIVFDTQEQDYWPYYGKLQEQLYDDFREHSDRYKAFWITPDGMDEFWPFFDLCIERMPSIETITTIMDEDYYWKRIKQNALPKDFLNNLLKAAEDHRDRFASLPSFWGESVISDEMAKNYFFFYGNQDAIEGELDGLSGSTFNLSVIVHKLTTRPLSDYGNIFFQYWDGYHTANMVVFLREQKERMDRGEDITVPDVDETSTSKADEDAAPTFTPSIPKFIFIAERQRVAVKRQLSYGLDEENKTRLNELIDLNEPNDKISTTITSKVLADYFRQIYEAGDINNTEYTKDEIGEWLAYWFRKPNGKSNKPESFKDYLQTTNANKKIKEMPNRIQYKRIRT